jgi:hypothetical protein
VFDESSLIRGGKVHELRSNDDFPGGDVFFIDVKVLLLHSHKINIAGEQDVANRIDNGCLASVILTNKSSYAALESQRENSGSTKGSEILNLEFSHVHIYSSLKTGAAGF